MILLYTWDSIRRPRMLFVESFEMCSGTWLLARLVLGFLAMRGRWCTLVYMPAFSLLAAIRIRLLDYKPPRLSYMCARTTLHLAETLWAIA